MKKTLILAAALATAACGADEPGRLPREDRPADVTVSRAHRAPGMETYPASVESKRTADIATRMSGTVKRVAVDVGSRVAAGDVLIALDATDVQARVEAATAGAELAERAFRRVEVLARDGAASQQELDQATAALRSARAALAEARAQEAYAVVRAPFAGVVTRRSVDPGDLAAPGRPLLTLVDPAALKVVSDVPANRAGHVRVGDVVRVRVPGLDGLPLEARVSRVAPALGPGSRTFRVEAEVHPAEDAGVLPGIYARLEVPTPGEGSRWIPEDAVVDRGQLTGVYTLEGDALRLRWVRLGRVRDGAVEVLAGPPGELTVVRRPAAELFDGRTVAAVREEPFAVTGARQASAETAEVKGASSRAASAPHAAPEDLTASMANGEVVR